jgi:aminoglycoside phosphotransferase (APT) family kinase protein
LWHYLNEQIDDKFEDAELRQFEGGQSNPTFLITTGRQSYVMRKKPPGTLLKSAHQVEREYRVMTALTETDVPVPKTYLLCEDDNVIGTPFFVMEHVAGRVHIDTHLPGFSPTERTAVYRSFIESIAALHQVDYKAVGLENHGRPGNYYSRQIHRWSEQYKASETESLPAMLDWELSTIGHPLADLAYWCSMEYHSQKTFPENYAELGLMSEQQLLDYYCELTGRDTIDNWTFYVAFNLFRTAGIRQGVYKRGLDGNASSERWRESGPGAIASANKAWELVERAGLA